MSPIVLIGTGVLLLLAGAGLGFWLGKRQETTKTGALRSEFDAYRQEVTEHFGKTAAHFQSLGQEYQRLYEHLAAGAGSLCDAGSDDAALTFAAPAALPAEAAAEEPAEEVEIAEIAETDEPPLDYVAETAPDSDVVAEDATGEPDADASETMTESASDDVTAESKESESTAAESNADEAPIEEPTDEQLADTEAAEELLADRELNVESGETEKTIH